MHVSVLGWNKYLAQHSMTEAWAGGSLCKVVNLRPWRDFKPPTMTQMTYWVSFCPNPTTAKILFPLKICWLENVLFVAFTQLSCKKKSWYFKHSNDIIKFARIKHQVAIITAGTTDSFWTHICCLYPFSIQPSSTHRKSVVIQWQYERESMCVTWGN